MVGLVAQNNSPTADRKRNGANNWFRDVGGKAGMMKNQATIAVLEREIRNCKFKFGVQLFEAMKLSRNGGGGGGGTFISVAKNKKKSSKKGEELTEVDAVFWHCQSDVTKLLEQRTAKNSELIKANKPKALCYEHPTRTTTTSTTPSSSSSSSQQSAGEYPTGDSETSSSSSTTTSKTTTTTATESSSSSSSSGFFQRGFQFGLQKARETARSATNISRIKSDIVSLDRQIQQRKELFGIEMYDTLERLDYDNNNNNNTSSSSSSSSSSHAQQQQNDPIVQGLFVELKKDVSTHKLRLEQAENELCIARESSGMLVSDQEIRTFIESNPPLWAMLEVNIHNFVAEQCQEIAFRVALELMSGKKGLGLTKAQVTRTQFKNFQKQYLHDPKGSQEFFHRSVFAAFDVDCNGVLDKEEIDMFLDTFYLSGSIFHGDSRLPPKEELKTTILEELDSNGDGIFTFDEIRSLISGSHALSTY